MLGLSGVAQVGIAAIPDGTVIPHAPFYLTDYPNPRGPQRAVDLLTWVNSVNLNLLGQDKFFGAGPPTYDYPNPRGPLRSIDLLTWAFPSNLSLMGQDKFFGVGGPNYDYPNPRGYQYPSDLRTWTWSRAAYYAPPAFFGLAGHPNFDQPNPRGPLYPISLRTWAFSSNLNLGNKGAGNYDQPNPRGYVFPVALLGWIQQTPIPHGRVVGIPTLAFSSDQETASCDAGAFAGIVCTASDSPSGQDWSGSGYMAKYEIDTSIQLEGVFINALSNVYVDPTEVFLYLKDPAGALTIYNSISGIVVRTEAGHYTFTFVPNESGTFTYKWQGTGIAPASSPDTTFVVNPSILIPG